MDMEASGTGVGDAADCGACGGLGGGARGTALLLLMPLLPLASEPAEDDVVDVDEADDDTTSSARNDVADSTCEGALDVVPSLLFAVGSVLVPAPVPIPASAGTPFTGDGDAVERAVAAVSSLAIVP